MELFEAIEVFPQMARPIIIKSDVLRLGLRCSDAAKAVWRVRDDILYKAYHLFSYDRAETVMLGDKIPSFMILDDGSPDGMVIQIRTYPDSPYVIDYVDEEFGLYYGDTRSSTRTHLAKIAFDVPSKFGRRMIDGVPMEALVQGYRSVLFVTASKYCEYFSMDKQCLFCDLVPHASSKKKAGETMVLRPLAEQVAEVLEVAFHETRFRHLFMTAGTIVSKHKGMTDVDYWVDFLNTIRRRLRVWFPTSFQINAQDDEGWRKLHDTGVSTVHPNIEVWGKDLFEKICPGKAEKVGYDEWIRRTIRAVDFWGPGNVMPSFVSGVEMAQPFGFKTVDEALDSTLGGFDFLMSHGVLPRQGPVWCVEPNSKLAGCHPTPLEYYVRLGLAFMELREKHGFTSCNIALSRRFLYHDTEYDIEYWHGNGPSSRKAELASAAAPA